MKSEQTLQSVVDSLGEHAEKTALLVLGKKDRQRWSFQELAACARSFANGLVRQDFTRGDAVALIAENSPEWIAAVLGIIRAGMVAVPLDVQLGDKTLVHTLQDSKARVIITTKKRVERIEKLDLKEKAKLILLDAGEDDEQSWKQVLEEEKTELPIIGADDGAVLFYTSGTTGPPKGVPLSHGNIASQLEAITDLQVMSETDRVLLPLPLHHVYPFVIGMLAPLTLGLTLVLPFAKWPAVVARHARRSSNHDRRGAAALQRALLRHQCASGIFRLDRSRIIRLVARDERFCAEARTTRRQVTVSLLAQTVW